MIIQSLIIQSSEFKNSELLSLIILNEVAFLNHNSKY